jgi:prepilin-type N-terminal cleavage/methylation domain-containing protein
MARGLTLVEMMCVMAILIIVLALTMSVYQGLLRRMTLAQADHDLAALGAKLELFRSAFGQFPPGDSSPEAETNLIKALTGRARWVRTGGKLVWETTPLEAAPPAWGRSLLEIGEFSLAEGKNGQLMPDARFEDPWGQPYLYRYKSVTELANPNTPSPWKTKGVVLLSRGPDRRPEKPDDNFVWEADVKGKLSIRYQQGAKGERVDNIVLAPPE